MARLDFWDLAKVNPATVHSPFGLRPVFYRFQRFLMPGGLAVLAAACDPNVVIGARWSLAEAGSGAQLAAGSANESGSGGANGGVGNAGGSSAGTEAQPAGAAGDGGMSGAGGAPSVETWCATSPWDGKAATFSNESGTTIASGSYVITYVSGAQIHDVDLGYEVTGHYYADGLEAGHHVYSGDTIMPGSSLWLDEVGIVGTGGTIPEIEALNTGHPWPYEHGGGDLHIVLIDDDYRDNKGPGSRFCVAAVP